MAVDPNRKPSDPNKIPEWEEAQRKFAIIQEDKAQATAAAEVEVETRRKHDAKDRKAQAAQAKEQAKIEETAAERQAAAHKAYLATPLNPREQAELEGLEDLARGPGPYEPHVIKRLGELRIRAKVEAKQE